MAAYGAQRRAGKTDKQAVAYLYKLFKHVPVQPDSARAALLDLRAGQGRRPAHLRERGDLRRAEGRAHRVQDPKATLLIETPVALTTSGLKKPAAKAFYKYLWSTTAQKAFAAQGYRPVVKAAAKRSHFYSPPGLFTIATQARAERLDEGEPALLPPAERDRGARSRGRLAADAAVVAAPARSHAARRGGGLALGLATGYLSIVVLLPLAALVWASRAQAACRVLAPGDRARGARRAEADARARRRRAPSSTRSPARRSHGCSCVTASRAKASSTR